MSFSIPPPHIATPLDQKPKGMISPHQHHNEDLQLQVFDFYNVGKLIFSYKQKLRTCERVETFSSPRMWHHTGRSTMGHSTETIVYRDK